MATSDDDFVLFAGYKDGDHEAFAILERRYAGRIYKFLRGKCGNEEDAADLTQVTLMKICRSPRIEERSFAAWIYKVASNSFVDFVRNRGAQKRARHVEVPVLPEHENIPDRLARTPLDALLSKTDLEIILRCMKQLKERQYLVIQAYFYAGKTYEEIGQQLEIVASTVMGDLRRAMQTLRQCLAANGIDAAA